MVRRLPARPSAANTAKAIIAAKTIQVLSLGLGRSSGARMASLPFHRQAGCRSLPRAKGGKSLHRLARLIEARAGERVHTERQKKRYSRN